MLRGIGPMEIGLVLLVVLIVFGAGKLPQVGSAIGKSIREFQKAVHGDYDDEKGNDTKASQSANGERPVKS